MTSRTRRARTAGAIYLLLALAGPVRILYVPSVLFVQNDAAATAANIAAHQGLFRIGVLTDLFCGVVLVFLVLAFYRLFEDVNRYWAALVMLLGGVLPAAIDFINVLNDLAALAIVRSPDLLAAFDKPQRDALVLLFVRMHGQQTLAAEVLWGLWLFPLGALVWRSGFLPRLLGGWLVINGVAYLLHAVTGLLWPAVAAQVSAVTFPALFGEIALMLWLLVRGARPEPPARAIPA